MKQKESNDCKCRVCEWHLEESRERVRVLVSEAKGGRALYRHAPLVTARKVRQMHACDLALSRVFFLVCLLLVFHTTYF